MGRIQSSVGLVTGVPIADTVNQLMSINAQPRDRLQSRTDQLRQEQVAITELTALVIAVELSSDRLGQKSLFKATSVTASNTNITARSIGSPKVGSYSFVPVRQSQNQQLTSSVFASADQKFSSGEVVIHSGGFLDESVRLDQLNGGAGIARGSIRITDREGTTQTIDLRYAQTAQDVVDAINANDAFKITASLDGDRFVLRDHSAAPTTNLSVTEVGNGTTAADLGLASISTSSSTASGTGLLSLTTTTSLRSLKDGLGVSFTKNEPALKFELTDESTFEVAFDFDDSGASLGQLLNQINAAGAGKVDARIAADGKSLEIEDLTSGAGNLKITSLAGDLAEQLGLDADSVSGKIQGDRLIAGLGDTLLSSLNGGRGLGELGELTISDRSGATATIDLTNAKTLHAVLNALNDSGIGVSASLNRTKTGIEIIDTTGSTSNNLIVVDADETETASKLQIAGSVSTSRIDSKSLNLQHITRNTSLSNFNGGKPISSTSISFRDSTGKEGLLNLRTIDAKSVGDVIDGINALEIGVQARINDAGDGIVLIDTAGGDGELTVADLGTGTAAAQLGLAGKGKIETVDGQSVSQINGTTTVRIQTTDDTTLTQFVESLNSYGGSPVSVSLLNLGDGNGVRLILNSKAAGAAGRVAVESEVGLSFSETAKAQDALIAFGASSTNGGILVSSSTNTFRGLVEDVELVVNEVSDTSVTVSIAENRDTVTKQIETFVSAYNSVRERLDSLTTFDAASSSVGVLFGSSSALRVDIGYSNFLGSAIRGAGSIRSLQQLGVRLDENGKLQFDKGRFQATMDADPAAVEEFFTKEELGFTSRAKRVAEQLAGVNNGVLLTRSNTLQTQIEQNTNRLGAFDVRLDKQRTRLLAQFFAMETTIAKLQRNLTALDQVQFIPPFR